MRTEKQVNADKINCYERSNVIILIIICYMFYQYKGEYRSYHVATSRYAK